MLFFFNLMFSENSCLTIEESDVNKISIYLELIDSLQRLNRMVNFFYIINENLILEINRKIF